MGPPRRPVFLAQRAYRRRRLTDAARILPVAGVFLIVLPLFWRSGSRATVDTVWAGIYLFGVWAILVLTAAAIAWKLGRQDSRDNGRAAEDSPTDEGPG